MKRVRMLIASAIVFGVGSTIGIVLKNKGFLPTIAVSGWTIPALEARDYAPGSVPREFPAGDEVILVYMGALGCAWSNLPEIVDAVRDAKRILSSRSAENGVGFAVVGISVDGDVNGGLAHLMKFGLFDELMVGHGWIGTGSQKFIFGSLSGPAVTPQVAVVLRSVAGVVVEDERVLVRKVGVGEITRWVAEGAPYLTDSN